MAKSRTEPNEITAFRIKERRKSLKLTQSDLAAIVGREIQAISSYENGHQGVPERVLHDIASALKTTSEYLTGKTDEPNPMFFALSQIGDQLNEALGRQFESQRLFAAEQLCLEKLFGYRVAQFVGCDGKDGVICLYKDGEEFIFDFDELPDLVKTFNDLIDFECFKIKQKRLSEVIPLLTRAKIVESREQRETISRFYFGKDQTSNSLSEEE